MSKNLHDPSSAERPPSRNDRMSKSGNAGAPPSEDPRESDRQGLSTTQAFDEEGAGIAPKE